MVNDLQQTALASQDKFLSENEILIHLLNPNNPEMILWVVIMMLLLKLAMILFGKK